MAYLGMFLAAFAAATLFPMGSEAVLLGLLLTDRYQTWLLMAVATVGNVLGSVVNWLLGRLLAQFEGRKWFPVTPAQLARAEAWYGRYGRWSLLLSWVPVIGDPLTVAAGVLQEPLPTFLVLVAAAKFGRYLAIWLSFGSV